MKELLKKFDYMKKTEMLETIYNNCNIIGEDVDIIEEIYKFEVFSTEITEAIYNYVADCMGLSNDEQLTDEQFNLLVRSSFIEKEQF